MDAGVFVSTELYTNCILNKHILLHNYSLSLSLPENRVHDDSSDNIADDDYDSDNGDDAAII